MNELLSPYKVWPRAEVLASPCPIPSWAASRTQRQSNDQPVPALWVPWGARPVSGYRKVIQLE
jgi:hypothetical protein